MYFLLQFSDSSSHHIATRHLRIDSSGSHNRSERMAQLARLWTTCLHTLTSKMRRLGVSQTFPFTTPSRHPQLVCRAFRRVFTRCLSLFFPSHLFRIRGPPCLEQNRHEVNSGLRLALPILARRTRQLKNQHQHGEDLVPIISRLLPLAIADGGLGFGARTSCLSKFDVADPMPMASVDRIRKRTCPPRCYTRFFSFGPAQACQNNHPD